MYAAGHLYGGAGLERKMKLGAAQANAGIIMIGGAGTSVGAIPCTTTNFDFALGLACDLGTYSTTQATIAANGEGIVTVSARPDLIIAARMSGSATDGTALTVCTNTSASAGGTVVTSASVGANDFDGGTVFCLSGANKGKSRNITAMTASTSVTVTVPFPYAIAVGDTFVVIPYNRAGTGSTGGADGNITAQATTLFTEVDASIAGGTGGQVSVVDLKLNGTTDSFVEFILRLHEQANSALT